jgi:6-phosphogluconolactonase (cycloisomerase 2 family)
MITRPMIALGSVLLAAIFACTFGCGGANETPSTNTFVYVVQEQSSSTQPSLWTGSIAQLKVDGNGRLTSLQPSAVSANAVPASMAADPSGRYLLVSESGTVAEYSIAHDGTLTLRPPTGIVTGIHFTFTPDGRFLVATGVGPNGLPSNTLNIYSFSSGGVLTLVSSANIFSQDGPIAVDASSKFVYFASLNDNRIYEYSLSAGGGLTPIGSVAAEGVSPFWLSFSPKGFLYSPINGAGGILNEFRMNPNDGNLAPGGSFVVCSLGEGPATFTPSGKYAYVSCGGTVSQFSVDEVTGAFVPNGPDLDNVATITLDTSGKFAFALTDLDTVTQFTIGPSGTLSSGGAVILSTSMLGQSIVSTHQ